MLRPAAFLDRDGTIIRQVHHIGRPEDVELLPGTADAIRLLRQSGFTCVIISNQSAVGRGLITLEDLRRVQDEVDRQLLAEGTHVDGFYYSTSAPLSVDRSLIDDPDRKPGPGLLRRAAQELKLDIGASWMIGDLLSDLLAGRNAGCRGSLLVRTGHGADCNAATLAAADQVFDDLLQAATMICQSHLHQSPSSDASSRQSHFGDAS